MGSEPISIDWNQRYQMRDTPWEKGAPAPPLIEYLTNHRVSGKVLVPGCGYGHDVRLLSCHGAEPLGLDLAPIPIDWVNRQKRIGRESYLLGDLFQLDRSLRESFQWVFEHTCFCAIDPSLRKAYVQAVHSALVEGGILLAIFFIEIEDPEGPPFPVSHEEITQLFDLFFETVEWWVPSMAYPGRENREEMRVMRRR